MDTTSDGIKVQCCKEEPGKLHRNLECQVHESRQMEVVKQMARVNIDISGISELKWMRMGKFNSDDYYIYYYGQESLRRNGVALIVNQRV